MAIYVYSDRQQLAAELVGFAKSVGKEAVVLAFDPDFAHDLKDCGADRVCLVKGGVRAEDCCKAVANLLTAEQAELFAVGATACGRDFAARVAGYLDCAMVSDASTICAENGGFVTERTMYGGSVVHRERLEGLSVVTLPAAKFETISGETAITEIDLNADRRVQVLESAPMVKEGADLSKAEKIVCVGVAVAKQEDMKLAEDLAEVLGAELGCTRAIAEERHWLPTEQYIGISGVITKPKLYLSMGVSGQVQHVYGIRDSQVIVGIDINDGAPIFKAADYGIVGDMYEIVPLLIEELKQ